MRAVYMRAYELLQEDGMANVGSDQFIISGMFAQQETWRRLELEKHPSWQESLSLRPGGAPLPDWQNRDWHSFYNLAAGVNYEFGMALDDWSDIDQVAWSSEKEIEFLTHDDAKAIMNLGHVRNINASDATTLPTDIRNLAPPFSILSNISTNTEPDLSVSVRNSGLTWSALSLVTNLHTGRVPPLIHMCGPTWKSRISTHWSKTWFH